MPVPHSNCPMPFSFREAQDLNIERFSDWLERSKVICSGHNSPLQCKLILGSNDSVMCHGERTTMVRIAILTKNVALDLKCDIDVGVSLD